MSLHDLVIIGAGPCGLAAAISARREGLDAVVLDQGPVCSAITAYPIDATFFSTAEKLSLGGLPFVLADAKPTRRDALAYYRAVVTHFGLVVRQYERVTAVEGTRGDFVVRSTTLGGQRETGARAVVVATGYWGSPNLLGVPGEELPHVTHVYREGHEAFQRRAVVVGGGNSAAEASLDLWRAGARVTHVHFGPSWDMRIKPWVLPDIENRMKEGSIEVRWNSRVTAIRPDAVEIDTLGAPEALPADHVYLMTGFAPNVSLLRDAGVTIDPTTGIPAHDERTLETDVPGLYIVGVVVAGYDANKVFIENGRFHGDRIVAHLLGRSTPGEAAVSDDPDA
ncbi:MAG TPA: YpdA family putative bacillithiol disulfide reductase [Gemmatimonadaceae bacterium]|nr:YpdA family putative bacillithiol disulfide reductase [Gemmatimonadaceae bacterium]